MISGTGKDDMWGDAQVMLGLAKGGNDTFVFNVNNGHDKVADLGQGISNLGTDYIDVAALGIENFSELMISAFDTRAHESTITFSAGNDVLVQEALRPQDFIFRAAWPLADLEGKWPSPLGRRAPAFVRCAWSKYTGSSTNQLAM
ncbi:hypothetical protein IVB08_31710 [Bradyrhizobium sp. 173]|uniref:hypothetical protein n=1 Tax=Bradyrhizobium sp. 173 TaxID=2782644 RepID=UPI001FFB4918|nr:hypothetical protein [Bradyrhizobium sp. 173]MCK1568455.1 hypothetical protein [Bradyrhizobium sp. 173]